MSVLFEARAEFLSLADPGPLWFAYVEREGLDVVELVRRDVAVAVASCGFRAIDGRRRFDWRWDEPEPAAVIEMHGEDNATIEDLCAWPIARPHEPATLLGRGAVLGANALANPASWFAGKVLRCWRTPLEWIKAHAEGCCVVDPIAARPYFQQFKGKLQTDDAAHGWDIVRAGRLHKSRIVYEQSE